MLAKCFIFCSLILFGLSGCGQKVSTQKSLEKVAKSWSMTVRASQVMPVYPLEEDIRPGDIYLVEQSLDSEIKTWNEKGFLPLSNLYDRIQIPKKVFDDFYSNPYRKTDPVSLSRLPKAAFPSYTFEIDKRGSLGLAIPLSSVPVAISASGVQRAVGSVVFTGAETLGLSNSKMEKQIENWKVLHKKQLKTKAQLRGDEKPLILRLITRIFTIKGATVSLSFEKMGGTNIQSGSKIKNVSSIPIDSLNNKETLSKKYEELISELNKDIALEKQKNDIKIEDNTSLTLLEEQLERIKKSKKRAELGIQKRNIERTVMEDKYGGYLLPGGSIKVVGRSQRGVSMKETFEKPLVLGYHSLEYLVTKQGSLIPLGSIQDLIENPKEYRKLLKKFQDKVKNAEVETLKRNPKSPNDNPFNNQSK